MKTVILIAIAACSSTLVSAQARKIKENSPDKGTWVIESNLYIPKVQTVKFYNERQELVYEQTVRGKELNISKARVRKRLNNMLTARLKKEKPEGPEQAVAHTSKR